MADKEVANFFEAEARMANNDRIVQETYDKKNELESLVYDIRGKLGGVYADYVKPNDSTTIQNLLKENEEWLYGAGSNSSKGVYSSKIDEVRKVAGPLITRYNEFISLPEALKEFRSAIAGYEQLAQSKVLFGVTLN